MCISTIFTLESRGKEDELESYTIALAEKQDKIIEVNTLIKAFYVSRKILM